MGKRYPVDLAKIPTWMVYGPFWSLVFAAGSFVGLVLTKNQTVQAFELGFMIFGVLMWFVICQMRNRRIVMLTEGNSR